ncbi:protein NCA1 [Syzygium oleosum]|uniref:protein NCA1 n=1 Tax=Syzygium oleosum TaxID=219896 RepID=UPI0011D247ED|nr:protein NCA1 [Syzygium oleosum]XP_056164501.1 protein NCA1 [Syzygium oleosum]XP_056164502.1 protein NCA1 [Syzygium oleosum]
MKPVCPFVKASRPEDAPSRKHQKEPGAGADPAGVSPKCPFGYDAKPDAGSVSPKCPLGYDSQTFKLGPLSCMICQALLFDCAKCVPCSHVFCKGCIMRFKDCPLCGADIESTEADSNLQSTVDRFIEGHGRIKRSHVENSDKEEVTKKETVIYEDVSLERGAFLVQQAMRAFRAQNVESAKSRLTLCADDIRDQIAMGSTSELCSQLGAVLGMLGDCCRAIGDAASAVTYFEESVGFLEQLPADDMEITHTLSVSLNKIGDLKYYDGDLQAARSYYDQSLNVRRDAAKHSPDSPSQILDVAVSLAKVADVDRSLGNESIAIQGFQEGIKLLESLTLKSEDIGLQQRRQSVLEFLKNQLAEKEPK